MNNQCKERINSPPFSNYQFELITAINQDGLIGIDNKIPWHIPEDLQNFRRLTTGHIVIMGRKTFESLPNGDPLKERTNIVITTNALISQPEKGLYFTSMNELFSLLELIYENNKQEKKKEEQKIFIIGGSEIYRFFLPFCTTLHITMVQVVSVLGESISKVISTQTTRVKNQKIYFPYSIKEIEHNFDLVINGKIQYSANQQIPYRYLSYITK